MYSLAVEQLARLILLHKNNFFPLCIFIGLGAWREGGGLPAVRVNLASDPACSAGLTNAKITRLALDTLFRPAILRPQRLGLGVMKQIQLARKETPWRTKLES